jgi:hypothetical protein
MTVVFIVVGVFVLGVFFVWALGRAAKLGDEELSLSHAEWVAREHARPHGNVDRL